MTAHKTTTHAVIHRGVMFTFTSCDTCNWTDTSTVPREAALAATYHEKDNR